MQWTLSTEPLRIQLDVVHRWLEGSYWSPGLRRDVCEKAFANSLVAGAYDEGRQLGVARVATDRATFAWLCDVYVDEAARGLGIGRALVGALIAHSGAADDPALVPRHARRARGVSAVRLRGGRSGDHDAVPA